MVGPQEQMWKRFLRVTNPAHLALYSHTSPCPLPCVSLDLHLCLPQWLFLSGNESLLTTTTHTPINKELRHQESRNSKDHKGQTVGFPNSPTPHHSLMSLETKKRSGRLSQKAGRELRAQGLGTTEHGARSAARALGLHLRRGGTLPGLPRQKEP